MPCTGHALRDRTWDHTLGLGSLSAPRRLPRPDAALPFLASPSHLLRGRFLMVREYLLLLNIRCIYFHSHPFTSSPQHAHTQATPTWPEHLIIRAKSQERLEHHDVRHHEWEHSDCSSSSPWKKTWSSKTDTWDFHFSLFQTELSQSQS